MFSSLTRLFCKTAECPTSEALLAYQRSLMTLAIPISIEDHLASCDFCNAELQLLKHYRSEPEEYSFVEMPAHLRRLAEALLKTATVPFRGMAELAENHQALH
jgi:EAL domain-containing protein (putative c-di-GMP-specific phosphodiesterase class I)